MARSPGALKDKWIYYSYSCPILKFEMRCHGWHYEGRSERTETEYSVDDDGHLRKDTKVFKHANFTRPYCWASNILFWLNETLSRIVSFFRRWAIGISPVVIVVCAIVLLFNSGKDASWVWIPIGIYLVLIGVSLVLAGLAVLWRRIFQLDEKTDQRLEDNGYKAWSTTYEGDHFD